MYDTKSNKNFQESRIAETLRFLAPKHYDFCLILRGRDLPKLPRKILPLRVRLSPRPIVLSFLFVLKKSKSLKKKSNSNSNAFKGGSLPLAPKKWGFAPFLLRYPLCGGWALHFVYRWGVHCTPYITLSILHLPQRPYPKTDIHINPKINVNCKSQSQRQKK